MTWNLLEFRDLPGIREACSRVARDLFDRKSVIWLVPSTSKVDDLSASVREVCRGQRLSYRDVSVVGAGMDQPSGTALAQALDLEARNVPGGFTPSFLASQSDWPDIVELRNLSHLNTNERRRWWRFVQDWAQAMRAVGRAKSLFVPVPGLVEGLPPSDVLLAHHRLWGHLSSLDMRMFTRALVTGEPGFSTWEGMAYPELAGADPDLVPFLLETADLEGTGLVKRLELYGKQQGWRPDELLALQADKVSQPNLYARLGAQNAPPASVQQLWRMGAVYWTEEHGMELHAAAVAMVKRQDILDHRIWRGQLRTLLPVLDAVRRDLCTYLNREHSDWTDYAKPLESWDLTWEAGIAAAEYGVLEQVSRDTPMSWGLRPGFTEIVFKLRKLRNILSHYQPLSRADHQTLSVLVRAAGNFK